MSIKIKISNTPQLYIAVANPTNGANKITTIGLTNKKAIYDDRETYNISPIKFFMYLPLFIFMMLI